MPINADSNSARLLLIFCEEWKKSTIHKVTEARKNRQNKDTAGAVLEICVVIASQDVDQMITQEINKQILVML
ncbi:hypothetical protein GCM10007938_29760 [Vibrio zhanjiangensis]|uniref:Uncharacterized protein n=1 Tax=Vibrio zhanjiangensis TaxID=1046128 RepID=A0ABQ6F1R5_9VIBR|nr:hypothetical protein GCM10007938_29760 [Vibrio zhanjiangensis]